MASEPSWGPSIGNRPLKWTWIGPTNDPWVITDEFETFGDNHFWQGQTRTKIFVQIMIHFIKIQNIHSKQIFIFLKIQNIHSNKIFIFLKSRIFIQKNYSFFQNPEYSFKPNIHFFKNQNIHSKKLFIFLKSRIFIQRKYSFF